MIIALFNNLTVIFLTLVSVRQAKSPMLLLICAGILMVAVTADSMDSPVRYVKYPAAAGFALAGGGPAGFAVLCLADGLKPVYRTAAAVCFYMGYRGVLMMLGEAGGEYAARSVFNALVLAGIMAAIMFLRFLIERQLNRTDSEKERLARANLSELHEKQLNRKLVEQNYLAEKNARLLERENISRNIHNSVGHSITAAIMTLDAADVLFDARPEDARIRMNDANERMRGSLESIRRAVRALDEDGKPVSIADLISDFSGIIDEFVMDLKVTVDRSFKTEDLGSSVIEHEHAEFLTGALKEFLTNGVKHGGADYFRVFVSGDSAHIRLTVTDNGRGDFTEENKEEKIAKGFGIRKTMEYAGRCGGKTRFEAENGFRAVVELPLLPGEQPDEGAG